MPIQSIKEIKENYPTIILNKWDLELSKTEKGIMFFHCKWSPIENALNALLKIHIKTPTVPFYVFDIDREEFRFFCLKNNLIAHGWGETFWVKDGMVIGKVLKYNSLDDVNKAKVYTQILQ
jgi:hypothetical protein